jgi:cytochrome c oxidase subunit 4
MSSVTFPRSITWTGIALIALWLASFGLSFVPLGNAALVVALVIAMVKAALVVAFFIQLAYEPRPMKLALFSAALLLAILIALMAVDIVSRDTPPLLPFGAPASHE